MKQHSNTLSGKLGSEQIQKSSKAHPRIPPAIFLQEAYDLYVSSKDDQQALCSVDLHKTIFEEMRLGIELAQEKHSLWMHMKNVKSALRTDFEEQLKTAHKLKSELASTYRYAFRHDTHLLLTLKNSLKGHSYSCLIQCLNDLRLLGEDQAALLQQVNFDTTLLVQANTIGEQLSTSIAALKSERAMLQSHKQARDEAIVTVKALVDAVRQAGQFVFAHNKIRKQAYTSTYWKRKNQNRPVKKKRS